MGNKENLTKVLVVASFLSIIITNLLSFIMPMNGNTITEIASWYPNFFMPSQYTFIIWLLIYALLGAFVIYQVRIPHSSLIKNDTLSLIRYIFITYCILNFIWMFSWLFDYLALSTMTIFIITACVGYICKILCSMELSVKDKLFIKVPFSVLYGWLSITSVINLVILLESIRWKGMGISLTIWAVVTFLFVASFAVIQSLINKDIAYCLTVIWSYIGILARYINKESQEYSNSHIIPVLIICILLLTGSAVYLVFFKKVIHRHKY